MSYMKSRKHIGMLDRWYLKFVMVIATFNIFIIKLHNGKKEIMLQACLILIVFGVRRNNKLKEFLKITFVIYFLSLTPLIRVCRKFFNVLAPVSDACNQHLLKSFTKDEIFAAL